MGGSHKLIRNRLLALLLVCSVCGCIVIFHVNVTLLAHETLGMPQKPAARTAATSSHPHTTAQKPKAVDTVAAGIAGLSSLALKPARRHQPHVSVQHGASSCFSGPDPVPTHRDGQCSGPSHPLGLWIQDAFVADEDFRMAYILVQDMRKCNSSAYWEPQKELYKILYTCQFRKWTEAGEWGDPVAVDSRVMFKEPLLASQIIIQCLVPPAMRIYGDNADSASQARLSVVVTPRPAINDVRQVVADHGPVPSTNQLGLCAHPVDPTDQTVSVASPKRHKLAMCMWAADSYKDRFGIPFSSIVPQVPEWLEHHLHVGVEHFYVYDNSEDERGPLWSLLQPYVKEGLATYIRWPHKVCVPGRISKLFGKQPHAHRSSQYAASNSCLRRYAQYNDWIAMFDVDEYLIPAGYGRPPPATPATPRLPATLTEVLGPYTKDPLVDSVSFVHLFHQPCGDFFDPKTHNEPVLQIANEKGTHLHFEMRTAADVGEYRRPGAQGDNAALFLEGYSCTDPNGPNRHSRRSGKNAVKPYKVLYQYVHYSVTAYDGSSLPPNTFELDINTQAKLLHFRAQQQHIDKTPDPNLTAFWLPELRRALQQPQVAKRLQAVQGYLSRGDVTATKIQTQTATAPKTQTEAEAETQTQTRIETAIVLPRQQAPIDKSTKLASSAHANRPQIAVRGLKVRAEVIQWDAHRPDSDVVLAMASGYGMNEWLLFVGTLRLSGFIGDICIAVSKKDLQNAELVKYAKQMNLILYALDLDCHKAGRANACRLKDFYEQDQPDFTPVSNSRFQIYMALIQIYSLHSIAFIADFRDVFFGQNPFPLFRSELKLHNADVLFVEEAAELTIGKSGKDNGWNTKWLGLCYGKEMARSLHGKSVFCSGTTVGLAGGMFTYFDAMLTELTRLECSTIPGADQGMHNYLIHTNNFTSLTVETIPQGKGSINSLSALFRLRGPLASLGLLDKEGFVLNDDKKVRSAVVHQWDRDPQVTKWVKTHLLRKLRIHSEEGSTSLLAREDIFGIEAALHNP